MKWIRIKLKLIKKANAARPDDRKLTQVTSLARQDTLIMIILFKKCLCMWFEPQKKLKVTGTSLYWCYYLHPQAHCCSVFPACVWPSVLCRLSRFITLGVAAVTGPALNLFSPPPTTCFGRKRGERNHHLPKPGLSSGPRDVSAPRERSADDPQSEQIYFKEKKTQPAKCCSKNRRLFQVLVTDGLADADVVNSDVLLATVQSNNTLFGKLNVFHETISW